MWTPESIPSIVISEELRLEQRSLAAMPPRTAASAVMMNLLPHRKAAQGRFVRSFLRLGLEESGCGINHEKRSARAASLS